MEIITVLGVLWLIWAALLFGGFSFGRINDDHTRRMPAWTRMGSSLTLVIAAWITAIFTIPAEQSITTSPQLWIAIGMLLGFVGDLFMAGWIPARFAPKGEQVLGGIGAFGLGHIAYIVGIIIMITDMGANDTATVIGSLILLWIVATVAWYLVVYRPAKERTFLHIAALPYSLLLATTTGLALGLALQDMVFRPLAIGAFLFLVSDLILAARLFNKTFFMLIDDVVWLTYGPGQMLIVYTLPYLLWIFLANE